MNRIVNFKNWNRRTFKTLGLAIIAGVIIITAVAYPQPAQAHCDSVQGPVVQAAQKALDKSDIKLILPYVKPDDEAELKAAFEHTLAVRKLGGDAKKLADQYFFETAVRLHRQGEGAPYTGLKDEKVPGSIQAADKALQSGNLEGVTQLLSKEIEHGLAEQYKLVVDSRANAKKLGTLDALREQAEAELMFEKYVYGLFTSASGAELHTEGAEPTH